jgi:uncharacterized protein
MLGPGAAVGIWIALCGYAAFYGRLTGHGPRAYGAMLVALGILLGGTVWLASPAICEKLARVAGPQGGVLVALWPLCAYAVYAVGTGTFTWERSGIAAAYSVAPVALAASAHGKKPGAWQDYAGTAGFYVGYGWLRYLVPFPEHSYFWLPLFAVNVALAAFLLVRRMEGVGYSIGWRFRWMGFSALSFAIILAIDAPVGIAIHFVRFDPGAARWSTAPLAFLGILAFTAWPEEFLFRGVLQNLLGKTLRSENAGWVVASVVFGLAHIFHPLVPNWRYVLVATIAGSLYGFAWRKTGSIFPAALVHALVDTTWHLLFRTL